MKRVKTTVLTLAALLVAGSLAYAAEPDKTETSKTETTKSAEPAKPIDQTFGKSFVKQIPDSEMAKKEAAAGKNTVKKIPESEVAKKETEMTAPNQKDKGPAIGSKDAYTKTQDKLNKQKQANRKSVYKSDWGTNQKPTGTADTMTGK